MISQLNITADMLSRIPQMNHIYSSNDIFNLKQAQNDDKDCKKIYKKINKPDTITPVNTLLPYIKQLIIKDDRIYYKQPNTLRTIVSQSKTTEIIKFFHNEKIYNHPGIYKTLENIKNIIFRQKCQISTGAVERLNRTLRDKIRTNCNEDNDNWDEFLPLFLLSIRNSISHKTGYSPSQILYNKSLTMPIHNVQNKQKILIYNITKTNMKKNYDHLALKKQNDHAAQFTPNFPRLTKN
ncbi:hypothetical protein A3Q56_00914 [Intoshia linei]|uniref:Integrase catalytic domain-containing protein n=1 Tax=Intoshia linei TaxID=1819745 RepID=A0A177BAV0_9BILA|nr:hypothetical protein A3Q56_00914 [Intoshia linei]